MARSTAPGGPGGPGSPGTPGGPGGPGGPASPGDPSRTAATASLARAISWSMAAFRSALKLLTSARISAIVARASAEKTSVLLLHSLRQSARILPISSMTTSGSSSSESFLTAESDCEVFSDDLDRETTLLIFPTIGLLCGWRPLRGWLLGSFLSLLVPPGQCL